MEDFSVLIRRAQEGEKKAREVLIEKNLGLVHHLVRRFTGRGAKEEDLFQIGAIGLMKAVDKFDLTLGVQFSTYAVPLILGEIRRFLREDGPVKISRNIRENNHKLMMIREKLEEDLGRNPTLNEMAAALGLNAEETILALSADGCVDSLEQCAESEEGASVSLLDRIAAGSGGGVRATLHPGTEDPEKERLLDHMLIKDLLAGLREDDRKLICLRYFREMTQTEISEILGISQVQVSRREKRILEQLRQKALDSF